MSLPGRFSNRIAVKRITRFGFFVAACIWVAVDWNAYNVARLRAQPATKPELLPIESTSPTWDGAYPTLVINPSRSRSGDWKFSASIAMRKPSVRNERPLDEFDVALDSGMFVLRQTDLFIPDVMPCRSHGPIDLGTFTVEASVWVRTIPTIFARPEREIRTPIRT
ncbi:MAG: hypothetical protein JWO91_131 [Acidobacteriaceae bacterium]|nr:hypothetical protein [Acidobacteriaceae bacterium]